MRLYEKRRRRRRRQRFVILSIFAILVIGLAFLLIIRTKTQYGASGEPTELSREPPTAEAAPKIQHMKCEGQIIDTNAPKYPRFSYSKDWGAYDSYLLAKIAMAEAEGESVKGKALVILVVLNRVRSDDFPDTISEVIYQDNQFTPVTNGRFAAVEPNAACWTAVESVLAAQYDYSEGALYFESCKTADNWHSQNLKFLYQVGNHKFYK